MKTNYLEKKEFEWAINVVELQKPTITATISQANTENPAKNNHYIYICTKGKKNE